MGFNKVAVVTGGSKGIGKAICEMILEEGYQVVFIDNNESMASAFLEEKKSPNLNYRYCDISQFESINKVCEEILEKWGTVSVLINNAGIQTHSLFTDMTAETWKYLMDVDLNSLFYISKCFLPAMLQQNYGRIINMSSVSAFRGSNRHVHYNTAKAGILGFTRGLSYEAARYGVTVNAICPGVVETDIIKDYVEEKKEQWLSAMHIKRLGKPEDIANIVRFLISERSEWITGQTFHINGGLLTP